jgi:hypothetical protein
VGIVTTNARPRTFSPPAAPEPPELAADQVDAGATARLGAAAPDQAADARARAGPASKGVEDLKLGEPVTRAHASPRWPGGGPSGGRGRGDQRGEDLELGDRGGGRGVRRRAACACRGRGRRVAGVNEVATHAHARIAVAAGWRPPAAGATSRARTSSSAIVSGLERSVDRPVRPEVLARVSPLWHRHVIASGTYHFGGRRAHAQA